MCYTTYVSFSSCQRNLIKTFQIEGMIALITKMTLIFFLGLVKWWKKAVKNAKFFQMKKSQMKKSPLKYVSRTQVQMKWAPVGPLGICTYTLYTCCIFVYSMRVSGCGLGGLTMACFSSCCRLISWQRHTQIHPYKS